MPEEEKNKSGGPGRRVIYFLAILAFALSFTYLPNFWWHIIMLADYFTPWKAFSSPMVKWYHSYLISRLPDREDLPATEIPASEATKERVEFLSKGYTVPLIIRGAMDVSMLNNWKDKEWWLKNYGDEAVLCKYVQDLAAENSDPSCTIKDSFGSRNSTSGRMYISGESKIFVRRPELASMVNTKFLDSIAPGPRVFTQLFMGFSGMGSDVHSAIGCNIFRQISGRKKWWLFPQTQTAYVYASINANGFSSHTLTKIGKGKEEPSPWLKKLERYTVTLNPGDVLVNTAWYWHGIENLPGEGEGDDDLIIGVPTRYAVKYAISAFRSNWLLTSIALVAINIQYGAMGKFLSNANNLQDGIEKARNTRARQINDEDGLLERNEPIEQ